MSSYPSAEGAVQPQPGPLPAPQPPRRKGSWVRTLLITLAVLALLFTGLTALGMWLGRDAIGGSAPGACLSFTDGEERPYREVDCTEPGAGFVLLAEKATSADCVEVPGTSRVFTDGDTSYCIGRQGVDVSTAINAIQVGECLTFVGEEPSKAPCRAGASPVLAVIHDVDKSDTDMAKHCVEHGADNARQTYAWGISSDQSQTVGTWDRLLCLGEPLG